MLNKTSPAKSQADGLRGHTNVTMEEDEPPGAAEVRLLMKDGDFETIQRWLVKRYPDAKSDIEDAVVDAVVRYMAARAKGKQVSEPAAWVRVAAKNRILNILERQVARETDADGLVDLPVGSGEPTFEDKDAFHYLKALIERWPSGRLRVVTLLYLEAGYEQEPLSQQESAEMASLILDEDVPWTAIGKTRQRGFERLNAEILEIASQTGINPMTGEETA